MSKKIKVGVDINEVLRARWLQFDRFYAQEFGDNYEPKYVYDFFNEYKWSDKTEVYNELKEPDEVNVYDDANPIYYLVDEKTNKAIIDDYITTKKEVNLSAKEVFNRFMFEDYCFEIHGSAPKMYKDLDLDFKNLVIKYGDFVDFVVLSTENFFTIPSTLFFLSKITSRAKRYVFVEKSVDMWKECDVLITTDPVILNSKIPWRKILIKVKRPYNDAIKIKSLEILQIKDLIDNKDFEKIIKYKKDKDE